MSIFAILRSAKKAADEHKKKAAQSAADSKAGDTAKRRYKHVPTHAALDSMNIGSSHKHPEMQERVKTENRKIRALSPKRAAMIRARQRSVHADRNTPGDSSISSMMEEYHNSPRVRVEDTDMLRPPRITSTYRHSTFDALVKTRPRYRSSADSLHHRGRSPLSTTPESSAADFTPSLDTFRGKHPRRHHNLTPRLSHRELRTSGTNGVERSDSSLSKPTEKSFSNKGKRVKFLTTLEPTIIEDVENDTSSETESQPPTENVNRPPSPVEVRPSSPSLESSSSQEDSHGSIYGFNSQDSSDSRVPSSNTSIDSVSSLPSRDTDLHKDYLETEKHEPAFSSTPTRNPQPIEIRQEMRGPVYKLRYRTKKSLDLNVSVVNSKNLRSRSTTSATVPRPGHVSTTQNQREVISPFERDPFSYSGTMTHFQPLSPGMLGVLPDQVPDSISEQAPLTDRFPSRNWAIPPTPLEKFQDTNSRGKVLTSNPPSLDFPTYDQDATAKAKAKPAKRSRLAFLRKYTTKR